MLIVLRYRLPASMSPARAVDQTTLVKSAASVDEVAKIVGFKRSF